MLRDLLEACLPHRVDRPELLEVTAEPLEHLGADLFLFHVECVVDGDEARLLRLHERVEGIESLGDRMTAPTIEEPDDRRGSLQGVLVFWPSSGEDQRLDVGLRLLEQAREKQATGVAFVCTVAVARCATDEDDADDIVLVLAREAAGRKAAGK